MKIIKYLFTLSVGALLGIYFSIAPVINAYVQWDAPNEAVVLLSEIQMLKNGEIDQLIALKEGDLNFKIAQHGMYLENELSGVYSYWAGLEPDPKYIKKVLQYRADNPYKGVDFSDPDNWPEGEDGSSDYILSLIDGQQEIRSYIEKAFLANGVEMHKESVRSSDKPQSGAIRH